MHALLTHAPAPECQELPWPGEGQCYVSTERQNPRGPANNTGTGMHWQTPAAAAATAEATAAPKATSSEKTKGQYRKQCDGDGSRKSASACDWMADASEANLEMQRCAGYCGKGCGRSCEHSSFSRTSTDSLHNGSQRRDRATRRRHPKTLWTWKPDTGQQKQTFREPLSHWALKWQAIAMGRPTRKRGWTPKRWRL